MPDLPDYEGFAVEQEKAVVNDSEVEEVFERIRRNMAELVAVAENRPANDGDMAVLDFVAYDGETPIEGVSAENFQMAVGEQQSLPEFEAQAIPAGEEGEGPITFPEDFLNPEFANDHHHEGEGTLLNAACLNLTTLCTKSWL